MSICLTFTVHSSTLLFRYDFEQGLNDLVQLQNDSIDWTIYSGRAVDSSGMFGPRVDHTTQEEHGMPLNAVFVEILLLYDFSLVG